MGAPLTKVARGVKGDGRYPEYPAVGVDDDVGVFVVLVGDRVERPDVALPHSLGAIRGPPSAKIQLQGRNSFLNT